MTESQFQENPSGEHIPYTIVTNNSLCRSRFADCEWVEGDYEDVLKRTRDLVHRGYELLSYPLGASVRMHFSPVVSILLSESRGTVDPVSMQVMEDSIALFYKIRGIRESDTRNKNAYELIDMERLQAAIRESNGAR